MSYTYSEESDLLVGDMMFGPSTSKQKYIDGAADDMNAKIGYIYSLPLAPVSPLTALPEYEQLLLKSINNKLASGRLIMDMAIGGEQQTLHAYAKRLVDEANQELMCIANGDVELSAERRATDAVVIAKNTPGIRNVDEESLVLGFENTVMRGRPWYSRPGAL